MQMPDISLVAREVLRVKVTEDTLLSTKKGKREYEFKRIFKREIKLHYLQNVTNKCTTHLILNFIQKLLVMMVHRGIETFSSFFLDRIKY